MSKIKEYIHFSEFYHTGGLSAIFENFLAMIPATILMPIIVNSAAGINIFNISNVLLATGLGTILFLFITKGCLPDYLGSSFAYIGVTSYICNYLSNESRENILSYIAGTYLFSATLLIVLAILCRLGEKKTNRIIDFLIPPSVMGPVVSLIGLELSAQAVDMAGLTGTTFNIDSIIALLVVALFILFSVMKRRILKNAAIFSAFIVVSIGCIIWGYWDISSIRTMPIFVIPETKFIMPKFYAPFLIMIIPPTFIIFSEHIARKLMVENLKYNIEDKTPNTTLSNSIAANGSAFMISILAKGTPLTLYAENIAVMRINSFVNVKQFIGVSIIAMMFAFINPVLYLIQNIPTPIIGGLSLSLMGVIAVPGIKLLVDRKVNYNKISNLLLTSAVLIAGLSEIKITILSTEFKGMSLGLLVGIVLNLFLRLLTILKLNKEPFRISDIREFAQTFENVTTTTHDNANNDFVITSFYIKNVSDKNLFLEITKNYRTWKIQVQTKVDMTSEEKRQCYNDFKATPNSNGILVIEAEQLNSRKKLENVIENSYNCVMKHMD